MGTRLLTSSFEFDVMEDRTLFLSEAFIQFAKNILKSMTGSSLYVLKIAWEPEGKHLGYTNGRKVYINAGHPYCQHYKKQRQRCLFVLAVLFHEIGHLLDGDLIKDYQKTLENIQAGKEFCKLPKNLTKEEQELLKVIDNPMFLPLFGEFSNSAYNIGLDAHDETALANNFAAHVEQCFALHLGVHIAKMPTLQQLRIMNAPEISVVTALMFQYIRFGLFIMDDTKESHADPAVVFIESCKEFLDVLRYSDVPEERRLALFRLLAALWPYIRDYLEMPPLLPFMPSPPMDGDGDNDSNNEGVPSDNGSSSDKGSDRNEDSDKNGGSGAGSDESGDNKDSEQSGSGGTGNEESQNEESGKGCENGSGGSEGGEGRESDERADFGSGAGDGNENKDADVNECSGSDSKGQNNSSSQSSSGPGGRQSLDNSGGSDIDGCDKDGGNNASSREEAPQQNPGETGSDGSTQEQNDAAQSEGKSGDVSQDGDSPESKACESASTANGSNSESAVGKENWVPDANKLNALLEEIQKVSSQFRKDTPTNIEGKSIKVGKDWRPIRKKQIGEQATENLLKGLSEEMTASIMSSNQNADVENEASQEIGEITINQDANSPHSGIPVNILRPTCSLDTVKAPYNIIRAKVESYAVRTAQEVKMMFEELREGTTFRCRRSGRVDSRGLSRIKTNQRIFFTKKAPTDEDDMAICLLIDQSDSMAGINDGMVQTKISYARETAVFLEIFARKAEIPLFICGHNKTVAGMNFYVHKAFDSTSELDRCALAAIGTGGCNRDGYAIYIACEMLAKRPEQDKLFIILSDGLPNDSSYGGKAAAEDIRSIVGLAKRKHGIETLACAIGKDRERIKEIYGNSYLDVADLSKLPKTLTRLIRERIE